MKYEITKSDDGQNITLSLSGKSDVTLTLAANDWKEIAEKIVATASSAFDDEQLFSKE